MPRKFAEGESPGHFDKKSPLVTADVDLERWGIRLPASQMEANQAALRRKKAWMTSVRRVEKTP